MVFGVQFDYLAITTKVESIMVIIKMENPIQGFEGHKVRHLRLVVRSFDHSSSAVSVNIQRCFIEHFVPNRLTLYNYD